MSCPLKKVLEALKKHYETPRTAVLSHKKFMHGKSLKRLATRIISLIRKFKRKSFHYETTNTPGRATSLIKYFFFVRQITTGINHSSIEKIHQKFKMVAVAASEESEFGLVSS